MQSPPARSGIDAMHSFGTNLSHTLRMTNALVAVGRYVDLMGLDRQVGLLCAKALDLPPEDGRALRSVLVNLLADLDTLSNTIGKQTTQIPDG